MAKNFFDKISADKNQLGFEYQDLVCLEQLVNMKPGEVVGLEVFDDVHRVELDGNKILIQVKHSINSEEALTNRDVDLWKTLFNWGAALESLTSTKVEFVFLQIKKEQVVRQVLLSCYVPK